MTKIYNVVHILNDIAYYLNENADIHKFSVLQGGRTHTIYKANKWFITVKRDSENIAYAVEIRLKAETKLSDLTD